MDLLVAWRPGEGVRKSVGVESEPEPELPVDGADTIAGDVGPDCECDDAGPDCDCDEEGPDCDPV